MAEQGPRTRCAKQTVLIAGGERTLAEAVAVTLDREGLRTVVAHDGEQVLALARTLQLDLIILDVKMPGRSGVEVCAALKTDPTTASIPVILLTAGRDEADRRVGIAAGAGVCLTKPFSPTELIGLVDAALTGRPIEPSPCHLDPSPMPDDQLLVYARELRQLSERERIERQALEEACQRLDELDRLKAAFLSAVTHELLTPFASIGLTLQVLQRQGEGFQPEQRDALDDLMTEVARLHRLVSGVVKFAGLVTRRRKPQPRRISLDRVIPRAVRPVAVLAQAREVDFRVFVPPDLPQVHADPELLEEAVFQMAHNAVKFNLPGGRARVRASEHEGCVVIEVADTGVGLAAERLAVLGRPFEQCADDLRRGREGLGVGWAFVCYVAELQGGWTRVESPGPGQGSTFSLTLPAVSEGPGLGAVHSVHAEGWGGETCQVGKPWYTGDSPP